MVDLEQIQKLKIVVLGDIMLDTFVSGTVDRISPEAPVPVLKQQHIQHYLGGAGNVAANLLELGAQVTIFSSVGKDSQGTQILKLLEKYDNLEAYISTISQPTICKTRYTNRNHHLLRVDQEEKIELDSDIEDTIIRNLQDHVDADAIIISDYDKGYITHRIKIAIAGLQIKGIKILDSKGDITPFANHIDFITPNVKELEKYTGTLIKDKKSMSEAITIFYNKYHIKNILVTASEKGMYLYNNSRQGPSYVLPSWTIFHEASHNLNPVDVSGAGDTVAAALAIALGLGQKYQQAIKFASKCAGIVISKPGTSVVLHSELNHDKNKINFRDIGFINTQIKNEKNQNKRIGFVNGVFDCFHSSHLELLRKAKEQCDYLVVAVNSDAITTKLKGPSRPIVNEENRAKIVKSCNHVDSVIIFDDEDPRYLIRKLEPHFIFKGLDYKDKKIIEQDVINSIGSQVVFIETDAESTTSKIIEKIKKQC